VRCLVAELLDTRLRARLEGADSPARWRLGERLTALGDDDSEVADEGLALLLHYYLGESFDEDVICLVIRRGQRILPHLKAYQAMPPCLLADRFRSILQEEEVRKLNLTEAIAAIEKGEPPPCD
jgi:hypothetical protein